MELWCDGVARGAAYVTPLGTVLRFAWPNPWVQRYGSPIRRVAITNLRDDIPAAALLFGRLCGCGDSLALWLYGGDRARRICAAIDGNGGRQCNECHGGGQRKSACSVGWAVFSSMLIARALPRSRCLALAPL